MKKIVLLLAVFGFMFQVTSCKSKKMQDDTEIVENADVDKIEAEDAALLSQTDPSTNVGPVDDSLQAALGETSDQAASDPALTTTETAVTETTTTAPEEIAAAPILDEASLNSTPAPEIAASNVTTETSLESSGGITEMPVSEPTPAVTETTSETAITETPVADSSVSASTTETTASTQSSFNKPSSSGSVLRKISETTPYQFGEGWVNTVYMARPKEKLKDISEKIYGSDKTKELKKINSFLAARSPKGGDKIYYVSPNRPADSMKTLSFYEDTGMIAETYVAKKGDNLKKISKNLLGYENAYKEVWSTNPVASKAGLDDGETLRYWKSSSSIAPTIAANTEIPAGSGAQVIESTSQLPSQPIAQNELPPPPPMPDMNSAPAPVEAAPAQAMNELPPPPDMAANPADAAAMTPPPSEDLAAAPVEPKKKVVTPNMEEEPAAESMNQDTTMMLGGAVVLCGLLAFALIRRNKKKKEVEMASMSETNVGT